MEPIWKDYFVTLYDGNGVDAPADGILYRIKLGADVIYTGRAYATPEEPDLVEVCINAVCADYFEHTDTPSTTLYQTFTVEAWDDENDSWVTADTVTFTPDWSYDENYTPGFGNTNAPINFVLHPLQKFPVTFVGSATGTVSLYFPDENGDFDATDFNDDFLIGELDVITRTFTGNANGHDHWLDLSSFVGLVGVEVDARLWRVHPLCGGVALYYINAYGYWDAFIPEGVTKRSDGLKHYTTKRVVPNGAGSRQELNYVNEVTPKLVFHTGGLTTPQSMRMHHLLGSPFVIMHDLENNTLHPVTLTGNTIEYKKTMGALHFYDIEAQLSQDHFRR